MAKGLNTLAAVLAPLVLATCDAQASTPQVVEDTQAFQTKMQAIVSQFEKGMQVLKENPGDLVKRENKDGEPAEWSSGNPVYYPDGFVATASENSTLNCMGQAYMPIRGNTSVPRDFYEGCVSMVPLGTQVQSYANVRLADAEKVVTPFRRQYDEEKDASLTVMKGEATPSPLCPADANSSVEFVVVDLTERGKEEGKKFYFDHAVRMEWTHHLCPTVSGRYSDRPLESNAVVVTRSNSTYKKKGPYAIELRKSTGVTIYPVVERSYPSDAAHYYGDVYGMTDGDMSLVFNDHDQAEGLKEQVKRLQEEAIDLIDLVRQTEGSEKKN